MKNFEEDEWIDEFAKKSNKENEELYCHRRRDIVNGRGTSSPVERGIKFVAGPVGRYLFCHMKISSHHIHR